MLVRVGAIIRSLVIWVMACSLVDGNQHFRYMYCVCLQGTFSRCRLFLLCTICNVAANYVIVAAGLQGHPQFSFQGHHLIHCGSVISLYCRSVSQDLSETILTMVGNCSILLTKPRQAPPGVLRHRGIEPAFNPSSLGGQVRMAVW